MKICSGFARFHLMIYLLLAAFISISTARTQDSNSVVTAVHSGSVWQYYNRDAAPTGDWKNTPFSVGLPGWTRGAAQLGYGDGDEVTITRTNSGPHPVAAYFRREFLAGATNASALLRIVRDDGAVVYINGIEILRDGMPDGVITHETLAVTDAGANENAFHEFTIPNVPLRTGTNLIAVEVHQVSANSTDLSFDLELTLSGEHVGVIPTLTIEATRPETSEPLANALVTPGEFTVRRADPRLDLPLSVNLNYRGSARAEDYEPLPTNIVFQPGENARIIPVRAKSDDLLEGTESVIGEFFNASEIFDPASRRRPYLRPANGTSVMIADEDSLNTSLPVVSIGPRGSETTEMALSGERIPVLLTLERTGGLENELVVYLASSGTATPGADYERLPEAVRFAPGRSWSNIAVFPKGDSVPESNETVIVRLIPAAAGNYLVNAQDAEAWVYIIDNSTNAPGRVRILKPAEGAELPLGQPIQISAETIDPNGSMPRVEFYAGTNRIGVSEAGFFVPAGVPITNSFFWNDAPSGPHTLTARAKDSQQITIVSEPVHITVVTNPPAPVVSLTAVVSEAREPIPGEPLQHGRFLLTRTGSTANELVVHLRYEGSAVADVDYPILPFTVRFAPGAASTNLLVTPFSDTLVEPIETVVAYIVNPSWEPVPSYTASPTQNVATVSIIDGTQINTSSLRMLEPQDGAVFQFGQPIQIAAEAIDLLSFIPRVEFYAGTNRIGVSQMEFIQAPPPGTPLIHSIVWGNAPTGSYFLSARAVDATGKVVVSESRFIKVGPVAERPTIALELVNDLTSELNGSSDPGKFRVRRVSGPTNEPVLVSFQIGGLAVNGIDYETVPSTATLPIGEMSKEFAVKPLRDNLIEGLETATFVLNLPGCGVGPYPGCYNISGEGFVDIHIQDGPGYTNRPPIVTVTAPIEGAVYEQGQVIEVRAEGTDIDGQVVRMEALIDQQLIAATNGAVIVARTNAAPGAHTIFVSARDNSGGFGFSRVVQISVRSTNAVATIVLNRPEEGDVFAAGQPIEIAAEAIDPFGQIARLEFYNGTNRIGVSEIPVTQLPSPGLAVHHSMVWSNAPAGIHTLTARARDSRQNLIISEPVTITVQSGGAVPVVGVVFQPNLSTEPWPVADRADGSFDFYRTGTPVEPLMVFFEKGGTATEGADYVSFNNFIVFAAGQSRTNLRVNAIDDTLVEPHETVVVELKPAPAGIDSPYPTAYLINPTNVSATVVIIDNDTNIGPSRINIVRPENGATFPVGQPITVEAVAVDPNGYIPRVEFFSGTNRIGVSEKAFLVPPPPGTPIPHSIIWSNAPAGTHNLIARGMDSHRSIVVSPGIQIRVGTQDRVLLTVDVVDALASETPNQGLVDTAMFRIRQVAGPTNQPIHAWIQLSGTATAGVDYQPVNIIIPFPTNQTYVDIPISPLQDDLVEGEETVFLTLNPGSCGEPNGISLLPFAPLPTCYGILGTNMGRVIIRDGFGTSNRPPTVTITSPLDGAVFTQGQIVQVTARASDVDGFIRTLELGMDGLLIGFTNGPGQMVWTNPPAGEHTFVAIATDNLGAKGESAPVRILVRETNNTSFAQRQLPAGYIPGTAFTVRIQVNVPAGTQAWGVEDRPPQGWTVTAISDGGIYDPNTGKVKFGHYLEGGTRTLSYTVRPPAGSSGIVEFSGIISLDGRTYPIGGQRTISNLASEYHPADLNHDRRIILAEVTGYAAAWKRGTNWPGGPNPIPATYVTHAALIWRQGEAYTFLATNPPPQCWVPAAGGIRALAASASTAIRSIQDGEDFALVTLQVQPGAGIGSYTVEEQVPAGWTVLNPSNDGVFDAANRVVRWGLYMDGEPRILNYSLVPANGTLASAQLLGEATLDGEAITFSGDATVIAHGATELSLPATQIAADGSVKFRLAGPAGQVCDLETSTDLVNWTFVTELFLPDGKLEYTDYNAAQGLQRYYRLKVR
jgi:hypothetical protein